MKLPPYPSPPPNKNVHEESYNMNLGMKSTRNSTFQC